MEDTLETGEATIEADAVTAAGRAIVAIPATTAMRDAVNIVGVDLGVRHGPMMGRIEVATAVVIAVDTAVTVMAAIVVS